MDNSGVGGMLFTDLSKACLRQDLLISKLASYDFGQPSPCFIFSYLSDRTQRTKVNNAYRSYTNGVLQGSILGPHVFNNDICDELFLWDYKCDTQLVMQTITPIYF